MHSSAKVFLIGGFAVGLAALVWSNQGHAAEPASRLPRGWQPPDDSEHKLLPAGTMGLPMAVERYQWHQAGAGGAVPGIFTMLSAGPDDWIALFTPDGTSQVQPVQIGDGARSKQIAKAAGVPGF